jgi:cell division protein FtsL
MTVVGKNVVRPLEAAPNEQGQPARRPRDFWVIDGGFDVAARVARFLGTTLLVTFIVGLVGALVLHATIIENQRDLDAQRREITLLEQETEEMRHQLAELEAPARIVAAAKDMGMIEAPSIVYLNAPGGPLGERTIIIAENQLRTSG